MGLVLLLAAGCTPDAQQPEFQPYDAKDARIRDQYGTVTGTDGISIFGRGRQGGAGAEQGGGGSGGVGVNSFLWRASLDTINFMPLASADPFGGLIITDWFQPAEAPDERVKLNILITDTVLRADALKVAVFRQKRDSRGGWLDAAVDPKTAIDLEDKILTRARQIRIAGLGS